MKDFKIGGKGDFEITFGSGPRCDKVLPYPAEISEVHAVLKRRGDRLFIRDCKSRQGTFLNGRKIRTKWREITLHDELYFGKIRVNIDAKLLLGKERVTLEAFDLYYSVPAFGIPQPDTWNTIKHFFLRSERTVCNHISVKAEPGTLTAIMGPSGVGKTILLNLLSGYLKPKSDHGKNIGQVLINDKFDVHTNRGLIKDVIGYVPQDDTLFPELSVRKSLEYCLKLRYSDMEQRIRTLLIEDTCTKLGFNEQQSKQFLGTIIGSQHTERGLSGGERKRANIAHELVRSPLLLFLDEPTSGLSSVDADYVIRLLKDLCVSNRLTVISTIHQPPKFIYDQFDMLILLDHGGKLVYFGPTPDAVKYFEFHTKQRCKKDKNPAEFILETLDSWHYSENPEAVFRKYPHSKYTPLRKSNAIINTSIHTSPKSSISFFKQLIALLQRKFFIAIGDRPNLALQLGQAPIIALLMLISFIGFSQDYDDEDTFTMIGYYFTKEYEDTGRFSESKLPLAKDWAEDAKYQGLMGEQSANRYATLLFLLVAISIWFGIINSSKEIISEKSILNRETKGPLRISSYIFSKIIFVSLMGAVQVYLLLIIVKTFLLPHSNIFHLWLILSLTTISASCLGLCVSAAVRTERAALTIVPLIILPQLLFGGLIRPFKHMQVEGHWFINHIHDLILQKWAFMSLLLYESLNKSNIVKQSLNLDHYSIHQYIKFDTATLASLYMNIDTQTTKMNMSALYYQSITVIIAHGVIPLIISYALVRKIFK